MSVSDEREVNAVMKDLISEYVKKKREDEMKQITTAIMKSTETEY